MKQPAYYAEKYKHMYMQMAINASASSVATRRKVGCLLYLNDHTCVLSWNGKPSGSKCEKCESSDNTTLADVIHAEANCIKRLEDAGTLHLADGAIAFCSLSPCADCSNALILAGISKVYYLDEYRCTSGSEILNHFGIETIKLTMG